MSIEAKFDPGIKKRNRKKLSEINSPNYIYKFYEEMEFTLRERDKNKYRGGVDCFGREIKSFELKDVYEVMTNDIISFI